MNDSEIISSIYNDELISKERDMHSALESIVYSVESYIGEIGSGEDFIQWFNWSDKIEIRKLRESLLEIGAIQSLEICDAAVSTAFPSGIPEDSSDYDDFLCDLEFEDEFEKIRLNLSELAERQIDLINDLELKLCAWIKSHPEWANK